MGTHKKNNILQQVLLCSSFLKTQAYDCYDSLIRVQSTQCCSDRGALEQGSHLQKARWAVCILSALGAVPWVTLTPLSWGAFCLVTSYMTISQRSPWNLSVPSGSSKAFLYQEFSEYLKTVLVTQCSVITIWSPIHSCNARLLWKLRKMEFKGKFNMMQWIFKLHRLSWCMFVAVLKTTHMHGLQTLGVGLWNKLKATLQELVQALSCSQSWPRIHSELGPCFPWVAFLNRERAGELALEWRTPHLSTWASVY